jgi:transposase
MFVRVKSTNNSPRKTVQIVENIRRGNNVIQKTVRYIGVANDDNKLELIKQLAQSIKQKMENEAKPSLFSPDELEKAKKQSEFDKRLEDLNDNDDNFKVDLKGLQEECRVIDGIHETYGELYEQLEIGKVFTVRKKKSREIFKEMVLARLASAKSKLASVDMLQRDFGIRLNVESVYRMMDNIDDRLIEKLKDTVYNQTLKLFESGLDVIFFDTATLYFESFTEDEFRKNGYSKDMKFNQPQVLLALLVTNEGLPVGYEVFAGDKYEGHTLIPCLENLRKRYKVNRVVFISDSGLFSEENITALNDSGFEYIVGARIRNQNMVTTKEILALETYKTVNDDMKVKEIGHKYGRLIISHSKKREEKDFYDRQKSVLKLLKKLRKDGSINTSDLLSNYGYEKYIKSEGKGTISMDEEKIRTESLWDGLHGIITNSDNNNHLELIEQYKQLWQIEDAFRIQKHDLKIRPVYHFKENRVKAHIAILFTAFCLAKHMQYRVRLQYKPLSINKIKDELLSVQSSIYFYPSNGFRYCVPGKLNLDAKKIYQVMGIKKKRFAKIISD